MKYSIEKVGSHISIHTHTHIYTLNFLCPTSRSLFPLALSCSKSAFLFLARPILFSRNLIYFWQQLWLMCLYRVHTRVWIALWIDDGDDKDKMRGMLRVSQEQHSQHIRPKILSSSSSSSSTLVIKNNINSHWNEIIPVRIARKLHANWNCHKALFVDRATVQFAYGPEQEWEWSWRKSYNGTT